MTHKGHHGTHRALEAFPVSSEPRLVSLAALATVFGLVSGFGATSFSIVFPGRFYPGRNIVFAVRIWGSICLPCSLDPGTA